MEYVVLCDDPIFFETRTTRFPDSGTWHANGEYGQAVVRRPVLLTSEPTTSVEARSVLALKERRAMSTDACLLRLLFWANAAGVSVAKLQARYPSHSGRMQELAASSLFRNMSKKKPST